MEKHFFKHILNVLLCGMQQITHQCDKLLLIQIKDIFSIILNAK